MPEHKNDTFLYCMKCKADKYFSWDRYTDNYFCSHCSSKVSELKPEKEGGWTDLNFCTGCGKSKNFLYDYGGGVYSCAECSGASEVEEEESEGRKDDQEKLRYDLLPPEALEEITKVLTFGAGKYDDRNWEKGIKFGRVFGALMRHLWAWWSGKSKDEETGISHLAHAGCCLFFLLTYEKRDMEEFDDRPASGGEK